MAPLTRRLQIYPGLPNTPLRLQSCVGNAMSRAHAVAPVVGAEAPFSAPVRGARPPAPKAPHRVARPVTSFYLERAMLLWPRLDRARVRKVADDPHRIAEIVERRTSQPFEVILAMLTRQTPALTGPTEEQSGFDSGRPDAVRVALRIVRSEEGSDIQIQDLLPA